MRSSGHGNNMCPEMRNTRYNTAKVLQKYVNYTNSASKGGVWDVIFENKKNTSGLSRD